MPHAALHDLPALVSLLAPDNEAERESIDPQEISQALTMSVDEMLARLDVAIHQIALDSRVMADLFWEEQLDRFEQKDPGVLGVRVRVNKGTLEIAYFRNAFTRKGTSKRTASFYAKHIKKSGTYRYNARDFSGAADWEKALALEHEEVHSKNRRLFAELSKARRYLRQLKKSLPVAVTEESAQDADSP